jgi:hypothetical protein
MLAKHACELSMLNWNLNPCFTCDAFRSCHNWVSACQLDDDHLSSFTVEKKLKRKLSDSGITVQAA